MNTTRILSRSVATVLAFAAIPPLFGQSLPLGAAGFYGQNFNTLPTVGGSSWFNHSTIPGWYAQTDNTPNPIPIGIYNGGSGAISGLLSMGDTGSTDRALGYRPTTTNYGMTLLGAVFQNTSSVPITIGSIRYTGEVWHTQDTANNVDGYQFFYQVGNTAITNLGPFTVNNGGTYAANAAVEDPGWTRVAGLEFAASSATANAPVNPHFEATVNVNFLGLTIQPGQFVTFRWRNPNDTAGDAVMGIDDFSFGYSSGGAGANLVYNSAHTVGGSPSGVLAVGAAQYWLNGGVASGFALGDNLTLGDEVTATIDVPAPVIIGTLTASANSGTYTIGGAGRMEGALVKSGTGGLVLTSGNAFSRITMAAGTEITGQGTDSLNTNQLILNGGATLNVAATSTVFDSVSGTGPLTKAGNGVLRLGGPTVNTYTGVTTVTGGILEATKPAGVTAIPGDLVIGPGAAFRYGGNTVGNQIADTANITINGGTFGDAPNGNPTNPGAPDTVASVTLSSGTFSTGRAAFATTGSFVQNGGTLMIHRGGVLSVGTQLTVNSLMNLDGGSTSAGQESRVAVGAGGLLLNNATINFNSGPSTLTTTSMGSVIALGGNVTTTGTNLILRQNASVVTLRSDLDLQGLDRTFDVTGTLTIGSSAGTVLITNGGIIKTGTGVMRLVGAQTYPQGTQVLGGKFQMDGSLASAAITVGAGGTFGGIGTASGIVTVGNNGRLEAGISGVGSLALGSLSFGQVPADVTSVAISAGGTPAIVTVNAPNGLSVAGGAGSVKVDVEGDVPALGRHTLIDYAGTLGGTGFAAFELRNLPNRVLATLIHDLDNTLIAMDVTAVDQPVWTGALSSEWTLTPQGGAKNWVLNSNNAVGTDFLANDHVVFSDLAGNPAVEINEADVVPASVRFSNAVNTYTLAGSKAIAGATNLTKDGAAMVSIANINKFTGSVILNAGGIQVGSIADSGVASPLGAGAVISLNGGVLELTGPTHSTNRAIVVGVGGGGFVLDGDLTLTGEVSGTGPLSKVGPGRVILAGANAGFNGTHAVIEGALRYAGNTIGGNAVTVALDGGTLENNDTAEVIFNDAATILRTLSIGGSGGTVNVLNATGAMLLDRVDGIAGAGTLRKTGPGILRARGDNPNFAGNWIVDAGTLELGAPTSGGTGTITLNGGMLATRGVTVNTAVIANGGTLGTRTTDLGIFAGPVNVQTAMDVALQSYSTPTDPRPVTISGLLSGAGEIRVVGINPQPLGGGRALILTNPLNTYSGTIQVTPGQYLTAQPQGTGSPLGTGIVALNGSTFSIRDDGPQSAGLIPYPNSVAITGALPSAISVDRNAGLSTGNTIELASMSIGAQTLVVNGANGYRLSFGGNVTLSGAPTFETNTADLVLKGDVSGSFGFTKRGPSRLVLAGVSTFEGPVVVQAGTLSVQGATSAAADIAVTGGVLVGNGTIGGDVTLTNSGSTLIPEGGTGILNIDGDVTFATGTSFAIRLDHGASPKPTPGEDYGQLNVGFAGTSAVNLNNANLALNVGLGVQLNDTFFVLLNDGADAINGTFAGLPHGAQFAFGGHTFQISYQGEYEADAFLGGNDVALMVVPEPGSAGLLALGFGLFIARRRRQVSE